MISRVRFPRACWCLLLAAVVWLGSVPSSLAQAQRQPEQPAVPTIKGTVSEVKKKGTQTTLVIVSELGGDPFEVAISPMMQFAIEAKGDVGFVREKQFASGAGFVTNGNLYVQKWTVHVGSNSKRMAAGVRNLPDVDDKGDKKALAGVKYVEVSGQILSLKPGEDDPNKLIAMLKVGGPKGSPAYFEKNAVVTVSTNDTALLKDGAEVEFIAGPGGSPKRPKILALKVILPDAMKSDEFFKADESRDPKKKPSN